MEDKKEYICENCDRAMNKCCGPYHKQYHVLRWVLIIILSMMIFSLGVKVGEIKGILGGEYGYRYGRGMMGGYGGGMMQGYGWDNGYGGRVIISQPVSETKK